MGNFRQQVLSIVRSKLFIKLLLEFAPLGLFMVTTWLTDIYTGSVVLGVLTLAAMLVVWLLYKRLALMAIITGVTGLIAVVGTVALHDPMWVKMKPTIVSLVFALILAAGLALGKPLLKPLIGEDLNLTERGWRAITWRWMAYFFVIAVVNETLWRGAMVLYPSADPLISSPEADKLWATSKVTFLIPFTLLYAAWMLPLLARHRDDKNKPLGGGDMFAKTDKTDHDKPAPRVAATADASITRG